MHYIERATALQTTEKPSEFGVANDDESLVIVEAIRGGASANRSIQTLPVFQSGELQS